MSPLTRVRWLIAFVVAGLILSGLTAFPLESELNWLASQATTPDGHPRFESLPGLTEWILKVRDGLTSTYAEYPFLAYGTDWLAFGHIVIALFFILPFRDPVRYSGVITVGMAASILVIPTALICGAVRGIPFYWQLIDCSFGVVCLALLIGIRSLIRRLDENRADPVESAT